MKSKWNSMYLELNSINILLSSSQIQKRKYSKFNVRARDLTQNARYLRIDYENVSKVFQKYINKI